MSLHSSLTGPNNIHTIIAYTYATLDDMTDASGFQSSDIGKVAKETDNGTYWVLADVSPTWVPLGSSALSSQTVSTSLTLNSNPSIIYIQTTDLDPYNITLPPPAEMTNRTLIFISYGFSENNQNILPNSSELIQGGNSWTINGPGASVTMVCDGTNWYVTASAANF